MAHTCFAKSLQGFAAHAVIKPTRISTITIITFFKGTPPNPSGRGVYHKSWIGKSLTNAVVALKCEMQKAPSGRHGMSVKKPGGRDLEESGGTKVSPAIRDEEESGGTVVIRMPAEMPARSRERTQEAEPEVAMREESFRSDQSSPAEEDEDGGKTAMIEIPDFDAAPSHGSSTPAPVAISLPPGRLIVLMGNDQGREFELTAPTVVVGRGLDCGVMLSDASVSRRHFQLEADGDVWVLQDLGSGNGTKVNGNKVKGLALVEGMKIEIGQTLLQFAGSLQATVPLEGQQDEDEEPEQKTQAIDMSEVDASELYTVRDDPSVREVDARSAPQIEIDEENVPARVPAKGGIPLWIFIAGGAVALLLILAVLQFVVGVKILPSGQQTQIAAVQEPVAAGNQAEDDAQAETKAAAHNKYNQGMKFFQAKDWDKAEPLLAEAVKMDPDHENAAASLKRVADERKNAQTLAAAKESLKADNKEEAEQLLKKIPDSSVYHQDAKAAMQAYIDEKMQTEMDSVRKLLKQRKKNEAKDAYLFLVELYPGDKNLKILEEELTKAGVKLGE